MIQNLVYQDPVLSDSALESDLEVYENTLTPQYTDGLPGMLEFHSSFTANSKQGILGLLRHTGTQHTCVYKMSQHLDYLIRHEHLVLQGLNDMRDYCPHFCKTLGQFETTVSDQYRRSDNPFDLSRPAKRVRANVLLMEHIDGRKLYRYIKSEQVPLEIVMSLIKQTLLATMMAYQNIKFTHYDLHSNNILVKKCPSNSVFLYILDAQHMYLVPTFGFYPVLIDVGFAYDRECDQNPLYGSLGHTDIGFVPVAPDAHADAKLFLTSVSSELKHYRRSNASKQLRNLVLDVYDKCHIDLDCGWDKNDDRCVSDQLLKKMRKQFKRSKFLQDHGHYVVDLLQSLIVLPLRPRNQVEDLADITGYFVTEFHKIERELTSDYYKMYIVKQMIDSARTFRKEYLTSNSRADAVKYFREDVLESIDSVVQYCQPKDVNWEKLLCSMLCLANSMENFLAARVNRVVTAKQADYDEQLLKSTVEIYEYLDINMPSDFHFTTDTLVYVWDAASKKACRFNVDDELADQLNETHPFERASVLHQHMS